jgi:hypothetical protein
LSLCLRASAAGLGLRRSTARTFKNHPSASRPVLAWLVASHPARRCPISNSPPIAPYPVLVSVAARAPIFGSRFGFLPARVVDAIVVALGAGTSERQDGAKPAEVRLLTILIDYFLMSEGRAGA